MDVRSAVRLLTRRVRHEVAAPSTWEDLGTTVTSEQQTVRVRWLGIAVGLVAAPFLLHGGQRLALWAMCACAAAYNLALTRYVLPKRPRWLLDGRLTTLSDILLADGAVLLTGGVRSELYLTYFLVAVASALRFSARTAAIATGAVLASYTAIVALDGRPLTQGTLGELFIRMGFLVATALFAGVLAGRARAAERGLHAAYDATLAALSTALDERDSTTEGHSRRVTAYARVLGQAAGLDEAGLTALARGAVLHDIGKIGVPDRILRKAGPLSPREQAMIRSHPTAGARILEGISFLQDALAVVLHHHEHWDGSGYPDGQRGEQISLLARIFAIVDCYDAMTSDRPYRKALSHADALAEIRRCSGVQFDPALVQVFVTIPEHAWGVAVRGAEAEDRSGPGIDGPPGIASEARFGQGRTLAPAAAHPRGTGAPSHRRKAAGDNAAG